MMCIVTKQFCSEASDLLRDRHPEKRCDMIETVDQAQSHIQLFASFSEVC